MPKEHSRGQRIGDLIQRELALLIQKEMRDPRVGMLTINEVKVSRDLAYADVYYTLLQNDERAAPEESAASDTVLNNAGGFLRSHLARVLTTRTVPKLRFHYDQSIAHGQRLSSLIDKAVAEDEARHARVEP